MRQVDETKEFTPISTIIPGSDRTVISTNDLTIFAENAVKAVYERNLGDLMSRETGGNCKEGNGH
jgi:hypothetical protein